MGGIRNWRDLEQERGLQRLPVKYLQGPAFPWERLCGAVVCGRERSTRRLMLEASQVCREFDFVARFSESEGKANVFY